MSLLKNVSLKLPSILTPQTVQDMAAICIGSPQHGQEVESILLFITINISISTIKINKNLEKLKIFLKFLVWRITSFYPCIVAACIFRRCL